MEWSDAPGHRTCRRLRVERQDLPQPLEGRVRHHRQSLEWTAILWTARQAIEGSRVMKTVPKSVRCAIYTRKSTDQGLGYLQGRGSEGGTDAHRRQRLVRCCTSQADRADK